MHKTFCVFGVDKEKQQEKRATACDFDETDVLCCD